MPRWHNDIGSTVRPASEFVTEVVFRRRRAVKAEATRDEILEAGFMAVVKHGGLALMYLVPVFKALDEFLPEEDG